MIEYLKRCWYWWRIDLDKLMTRNPAEAELPLEDNVVWEPMPQYGETEADRIYWRRGFKPRD